MIGQIWNFILVTPILNVLFAIYKVFGNMGVSIILLSILLKLVTFPQSQASLKMMKKQSELMPELEKIKKKYGHDKQKLAEMQMELYKTAGINPASGCLYQILPILVIIGLFNVINMIFGSHSSSVDIINTKLYFDFLKVPVGNVLNPMFLYLDLSKPDKFFVLPVLAAALQFFTSKLMMPSVKKLEKTSEKADDVKDDVMYNMQEQMLITMPIVFLIVGIRLPSGVVLNIITTTLFTLAQQLITGGAKISSLVPEFLRKKSQ